MTEERPGDNIPDSAFRCQIPAWMEARIEELKAEGKTPEEAATILMKEIR